MSYNKSYGGQFMGIGQISKGNVERVAVTKAPSKKSEPASKVVFAISELRSINLPEIKGDRYFVCTVIFDNNDVKESMEASNHNSQIVLGTYLHTSYCATFDSEIVLKIPSNTNFARCYVSCVTVSEEDGKRNIKLEGLGYTDPFCVTECKVYAYANCKLNTAVGAADSGGCLKLCVKCVDSSHPSVIKSKEPFSVINEIKNKYES